MTLLLSGPLGNFEFSKWRAEAAEIFRVGNWVGFMLYLTRAPTFVGLKFNFCADSIGGPRPIIIPKYGTISFSQAAGKLT